MKNYILYMNGRKEEIVFCREFKNAGMIFATDTDLYLVSLNPKAPSGYDIYTIFMKPYPDDLLTCRFIEVIRAIVIDDTDQYDYQIKNGDDTILEGYITAKRDASDAEIRKQITDTLDILYKKHPYLR